MKIGYARVSSHSQKLDLQQDSLEKFGCEKIYAEKISGVSSKRIELNNAIDFVREGDVFVCTKLDRIARSMPDLIRITEHLKDKNVQLVILDQSLDTRSISGKLLFNIIGAIAEFERHLIIERTSEGRALAKKNGVRFGRKPTLNDKQKEELKAEFFNCPDKELVAKKYGLSKSSAYRICKEVEQ
jgi:DNA invertase Pin-like site-specific DNA recombinase